jgi:hypothetical protein
VASACAAAPPKPPIRTETVALTMMMRLEARLGRTAPEGGVPAPSRSILRSGMAASALADPERLVLEAGIRLEVAGAWTNRRKPYEEAGPTHREGRCARALPGSGMVCRVGDAAGELRAGADSQLVVHA